MIVYNDDGTFTCVPDKTKEKTAKKTRKTKKPIPQSEVPETPLGERCKG